MADWLSECGVEPVFLDNNSYYEPLLEYYKNCPYQVIRLDKNYGCRAAWDKNILDLPLIGKKFILTDPDLDLSGIPDNFLEILEEGLHRYPTYGKCGFSLRIDDLPKTEMGDSARYMEQQYWDNPLDNIYFDADIDTTFALYNKRGFEYKALRVNSPYTAKHVPWYYKSIEELPADEQFYYRTAVTTTNWGKFIK